MIKTRLPASPHEMNPPLAAPLPPLLLLLHGVEEGEEQVGVGLGDGALPGGLGLRLLGGEGREGGVDGAGGEGIGLVGLQPEGLRQCAQLHRQWF